MSKATNGDDRYPQPGHQAIYDDWKMPRPGSVIFGALGNETSYNAEANTEASAEVSATANRRTQSTHHKKEDHE